MYKYAVSQKIDSKGKLRVINILFKNTNFSLFVNPSPPLDLPSSENIFLVSTKQALEFINFAKFQIDYLEISSDKDFLGIWCKNEEDIKFYIPLIIGENLLQGFEIKKGNTYVRPHLSYLDNYRATRKKAEILKKYTLFAYSLDSENFDKNSFEVISNYDYDIQKLSTKLSVNDIMFKNGKLIVPSKKVRNRLITYLRISLLNDKSLINQKILDEYYLYNEDFDSSPNHLIFRNLFTLQDWKIEKEKKDVLSKVNYNLQPSLFSPYFYSSPLIRKGQKVIIQNVADQSLDRALSVSKVWTEDKINMGYNCPIYSEVEKLSYILYDVSNEAFKKNSKETKKFEYILKFAENYSAILFF